MNLKQITRHFEHEQASAVIEIDRKILNIVRNELWLDFVDADKLEAFEESMHKIAFQIREFRMKNFPESESIDE